MIMPWQNCRVKTAGIDRNDQVFIRLVNLPQLGGNVTTNFDRSFLAESPQRKEMLATALTAITTGLHVNVLLESTTENSTIHAISVVRA
jgi:hypothetical protein